MRNLFAKPDDADIAATVDTDDLDGISATDCPVACSAERCCVTGINVCGHPNKGGLQARSMQQPAVLRRYNEARKMLAQTNLAKRAERDDDFLNGDTNV